MNENESKYYSIEEIRKFQERGVQVLDSSSVFAPEILEQGWMMHPGRIFSGSTSREMKIELESRT